MNLEQLKQAIVERPSYFKESLYTVADRFGVHPAVAEQAFSELSELKRAYNRGEVLPLRPSKKEDDNKRIIKKQTKKRNLPKPYLDGNPDNVLVIGDTHLPFDRPGYLEFCRRVQEEFDCGTVVHIGDEVDNCAMSFHDHNPDGYGPHDEHILAKEKLQDWYAVFPEVKVCIGNHTALPFRRAFAYGIPSRFLKPYEEMWDAPKGWKWDTHWIINDVYYTHGTGQAGPSAAIKRALNLRMPTVMGHIHSEAGVQYNVSPKDILWGMLVGCGVDDKEYAFEYAKDNPKKFIISCGVVLDGKIPIVIPMEL
jgi:hypothetical protein